ncbi:multiprotein bridging factor aMBF1 [Methanosphaera sp.]
MNCEICGSEIKGQPYKTKIDNSLMVTCKECSRYGKVQQRPQRPVNRNKKGNQKNNNNSGRRPQQTMRRQPEEEFELIDGYQKRIKDAREKQNLTQKKLGEKIYERESVIAHIESGKMVPDERLAHKLEKTLRIKIVEKIESNEREFKDIGRLREATIGDVARIKRS